MSTAAEFTERVRAQTLGSPYLLVEEEGGFTLSLNIVDRQWYTLAYKQGVRRHIRYQVRLDEASKVFRITDIMVSMRFGGGVSGGGAPVLGGSMSGFRGRLWNKSGEIAYGLDAETRRLGKVVDYRFSTGEGHGMIRSVGKDLGWTEKQPGIVLGAIAAGAIGLLAIPLVIVLAVTGNLS